MTAIAATGAAIPMPSVKLRAGLYEVLGTSTACLVMRTPLGWELVANGGTVEIFKTKRAALVRCQEDPSL